MDSWDTLWTFTTLSHFFKNNSAVQYFIKFYESLPGILQKIICNKRFKSASLGRFCVLLQLISSERKVKPATPTPSNLLEISLSVGFWSLRSLNKMKKVSFINLAAYILCPTHSWNLTRAASSQKRGEHKSFMRNVEINLISKLMWIFNERLRKLTTRRRIKGTHAPLTFFLQTSIDFSTNATFCPFVCAGVA